MTKKIVIQDRDEFKKLTDMGTTYSRGGKIVVATTVGVTESATTDEVDKNRVIFVYNRE